MENKKIKIISKSPLLYKLQNGKDIIIYNPYTLRKIFTSEKKYEYDLKKKWEYITGKFITPPPPSLKKIRVEATFSCNLQCKYCLVFNNDLKQLNTHMSISTAKKIVEYYKKNIKEDGSLMIIGGEPLVNWSVTKYLIENIHGKISLFTNGVLINDEKAKFFKKHNIFVMISLDGPKEMNKMRVFRDNRESYPYVIKAISLLKKYGCKIGICSVATNFNVKKLDTIANFFIDKLNIKRIGISFPHYTKLNSKDADVDIKEYTHQMIKIFKKAMKRGVYIDQISKRLKPLINEEFRLYACKIAGEQITFYPDGKKTYCTKLDTLPKTLNHQQLIKNRLPLNNKGCKDCIAIGICGGGCFWDGEARYQGKDKRECYLNNELVKFFLWDMYKHAKKNIHVNFNNIYKNILEK